MGFVLVAFGFEFVCCMFLLIKEPHPIAQTGPTGLTPNPSPRGEGSGVPYWIELLLLYLLC